MNPEHLATAVSLGKKAFNEGRKCWPMLDPPFGALIVKAAKESHVGLDTLVDAYIDAWTLACADDIKRSDAMRQEVASIKGVKP